VEVGQATGASRIDGETEAATSRDCQIRDRHQIQNWQSRCCGAQEDA
jgi:hypothetical protein